MDTVESVLRAHAVIQQWRRASACPQALAAMVACCSSNLAAALAAGLANALAVAAEDAAFCAVAAIARELPSPQRVALSESLRAVRASTFTVISPLLADYDHGGAGQSHPRGARVSLDDALTVGLSAMAETAKVLCEQPRTSAHDRAAALLQWVLSTP